MLNYTVQFVSITTSTNVTLFYPDPLAQYGQIGNPPTGRPSTAGISEISATQGTRVEEGVSHWRPAISQVFEGLLVEAVGETGEGGVPYASIQSYIRRCGLASYCIGAGTHRNGDEDNDPEGLWEDGRGFSDFDCSHEGGRKRGGTRIPPGDNEGWITSSEGEEDDGDLMIEGNHRHQDGNASSPTRGWRNRLVRSCRPPMFIRAPVYFSELLALGRVLFGIHRVPRGIKGGGFSGAADRARRQATAYCLTVVRMCCDVCNGGLDKTEPACWMGGGHELDEDATTMQRAQMMVDFRLAEKLAPCLHDSNPGVRNDAVGCALSAIRGGHARLRWISLSARETEGMDPRALLALGFCSAMWVSTLVAIVRGRGIPALGSANPTRSAREGEDSVRGMALNCLRYMAAAGDLATHSWRGIRVVSALKGTISHGGPGLDGWNEPAKDVGSRNARDVALRNPSFKVWKDGVLEVLQTLAENGSVETQSMLRAQGGQHIGLNISDFVSSAALTPKGVASRAVELLRGGTLGEIQRLVQRCRSILATAVRIGDRAVLGYEDEIPDDVGVTMSLVWGWMQRALVQLTRDEPDHPSTAARVSLVLECLGLIRFVLCSPACRLAQCDIHPDLAGEVSQASGRSPSAQRGAESHTLNNRPADDIRDVSTSFDVAAARTGLEATVLLLSAKGPVTLDLYRAHPIPALAAGAADVVADALTYGDRETVESMESYGMGLRLGLAIETSTRLVRESRRLGVEEIHLLPTYPGGRRARMKLLDRILWRAQRKLHEQAIISGVVEFIVSNMLPDCATTDIISMRLPASFMRYNGTPLVRNEGIALLERIVARRHHCPSVAREMGRQAVRHELSSAELLRLRRYRHRSIRAGVSACLKCLARLDSTHVDNALTRASVPKRAIVSFRRDHTASKTRRQWSRWIRHYVESGAPLNLSTDEAPNVLPVTTQGAATFSEDTAFGREKLETYLHDQSASDAVQRPNPSTQELGTAIKLENLSRIKADKIADTGMSSTALPSLRALPVAAQTISSKQEADAVLEVSTPTNVRKMETVLTIEGGLSTLSVRGLIALIAAELGAKEHSIRLIEVGGVSDAVGTSYTGLTASPAVDECVIKLSLPEVLADRLHTRCLGGVLRVPGLLSLKVRHCVRRIGTSAKGTYASADVCCYRNECYVISVMKIYSTDDPKVGSMFPIMSVEAVFHSVSGLEQAVVMLEYVYKYFLGKK